MIFLIIGSDDPGYNFPQILAYRLHFNCLTKASSQCGQFAFICGSNALQSCNGLKAVSRLDGVFGRHFHGFGRKRSEAHSHQLHSLDQNVYCTVTMWQSRGWDRCGGCEFLGEARKIIQQGDVHLYAGTTRASRDGFSFTCCNAMNCAVPNRRLMGASCQIAALRASNYNS